MSNKRKGDFTDSNDFIIKQSRQTVTSAEIKEDQTYSFIIALLTSNDDSSENSIIRNNTLLHNKSEEYVLPTDNRKTTDKSPVEALTTANCQLDEISIKGTAIENDFESDVDVTKEHNTNASGNANEGATVTAEETEIASSSIKKSTENLQDTIGDISSLIEFCGNDSDGGEVKVEETKIASSCTKKYAENLQETIENISCLVSNSHGKVYENNADNSEKFIDTVNSINRYVNDDLYYIESFPTYEDYIYITSCYDHYIGRVFRAWKTLPRSIVTVKTFKGHKGGVFAVRPINKGVRLGPIEMTMNIRLNRNCYAWKMTNGRLYYNPKMTFSNWTLFVNYTQNKNEQNLTISQHDGLLFFRTVRMINVNEELLVNYDNILTVKMGENVEMCVPYVEKTIGKVHICRLCHLGFKSEENLNDHVCRTAEDIPETELWECILCNSFMCEKKYKDYHTDICIDKITFVDINSHEQNYENDADDSEKYIDAVNSINRYVKGGIDYIESIPTYEDYIYITSCYDHSLRRVFRAWKTLPRSMVTVKTLKGHKGGVFAVRPIYKGVRIGPLEIIANVPLNKNCYAWELANGRLCYNPSMMHSNWTLFVNYTENKNEQNLAISQHDGVLFFRTTKMINANEELLVNYDNILTVKMGENVEMCVPYVEKTMATGHICRLCHLCFKSKENINDHVCKITENIPTSELRECPLCNSFICEKKYSVYHLELCQTTFTDICSKASEGAEVSVEETEMASSSINKSTENIQDSIEYISNLVSNASEGAEEKVTETEVASSSIKKSTDNIQDSIGNISSFIRDDPYREESYTNNYDKTYIDKVNSLNPYLGSTSGLYYIESNSLSNHFVHINSSYRGDSDANIEGSRRVWKTLPRSCLSIKTMKKHKGGVFAERSIPNGVRIGPIEGAISKKLKNCYGWMLKDGRLLFVEQLLYSNWARFVNYAKYKDEQNLTISQHLGLLYFRTVRDIQVGQELLVNYDGILVVNNKEDEYCVPYIEKEFGNIFACDDCDLVFKDAISFGFHVCSKPINILDEHLWVCSNCNSFVCELKYAEWHKKYCNLDRKESKLTNDENSGSCSKNVVKFDCSFTHISSINIQPGTKSRIGLTLPVTVLSLSVDGKGGVFAIEKIAEGVTMGPYDGLLGEQLSNKHGYLFQNGNFEMKSECDANWLRAVNVTSSANALNLVPFQHGGELYFEAVKDIDIGQELLVFFNSEILELFGNTYYVPPVRETLPFYQRCECMLDFKSEESLVIHQLTCMGLEHALKRLHEASCINLSKCRYCNVSVCSCNNNLLNHEKQCLGITVRDHPPKEKVVDENNSDKSYVEKVNSLNRSINSADGLYYVEDDNFHENFVHIASSNRFYCESFYAATFRAWKTLPRSCLSIKALEDHKGGVFATRLISKGVRMGPIEGTISQKLKECYGWRLEKNGRLAYVQEILYSNWTRFVNYTKDKDKQNLTITQHMGLMYFRTLKDIEDGQELLVNFDNILTVNYNEQEYCIPFIEKKFENIVTCDQCDLVFKDAICFGSHLCSRPPDVLDKDLWYCEICNIFMCEDKYKGYHQFHCRGFSLRMNKKLKDVIVEEFSLRYSKTLNCIHISSVSIPSGTKSRAWLSLPGTILTSSVDGNKGVFAMNKIYKGVTMGPYEGVVEMPISNKYGYLFQDGDFKVNNEFDTNWLAAVSVAPHINAFNVIPFQYDGHLYFEAVTTIDIGQELLVYLNSEILELAGKTYYIPPVRETLPLYHRCACMLSFKNEDTFVIHELTCIGRGYTNKRLHQTSCTNLMKCQHCNSLVCNCDQNLADHEKQCLEIISRKNDCTHQDKKRDDVVGPCDQITQHRSKIHMSSDEKYYKCGQCCFKGEKVDVVYEHLQDHRKWKIIRKPNGLIDYYMCKYCKKSVLMAFDLKSHYEKHVKELPYACEFCYFRSTQKDKMKIHLDTEHTNGWIKDADMAQGIKLSLRKEAHYKVVYDGEVRLHQCNFCDKTTKNKGSIDTHILTHTGEYPFSCPLCSIKTRAKASMIVHLKKCHDLFVTVKQIAKDGTLTLDLDSKDESKCPEVYQCDSCKNVFTKKGNLEKHCAVVHSENESFHYKSCNYKNKEKRKMHMQRKHKVKVGIDDICKYVSTSQQHKDESKCPEVYQCHSCNKVFSRKGNLERHCVVHSENESFYCKLCNYKSKEKINVQKHMQRKHKVKVAIEDICKYESTSQH